MTDNQLCLCLRQSAVLVLSCGQRCFLERWWSGSSCSLIEAIHSYHSDFQGNVLCIVLQPTNLSGRTRQAILCWGESCDVDKLSLLLSSQCGYVWTRREGSSTTTAFLSTVNKLSLHAPFRLPPSLELRTEDEQRGDGLTWRTDVSVCFAAKLYNLCRLPLFCVTGARCRQRRQVLKLCCKFMSWTHNKWMSLDPAWLYFLKKQTNKKNYFSYHQQTSWKDQKHQ